MAAAPESCCSRCSCFAGVGEEARPLSLPPSFSAEAAAAAGLASAAAAAAGTAGGGDIMPPPLSRMEGVGASESRRSAPPLSLVAVAGLLKKEVSETWPLGCVLYAVGSVEGGRLLDGALVVPIWRLTLPALLLSHANNK